MSRDTKRCLRDFISHVDDLASEKDPEGNGFNREYRMIHEVQVRNRRENVFKSDIGRAECNMKKNRYKDILPYDDHRVILSSVEGEEHSDYINASRLMGVKGTGGYIASQGPLAITVNDFWRMVWEYNVEIIFMACRIVELGKIKCKQYWNDENKSEDFGDISVYTEREEQLCSDFVQRQFRIKNGEVERMVTQFHYSGWPDHGVPKDPAHIRDLISIVRQTRLNDERPLLLHCSAGCGRTGAIISIDFVWTMLEEGRFDDTFSLYELICNFREQRMSIVQTADQYALVNQVLKSLCEEWLEKMASHTYVNVELNQEETYANMPVTSDLTAGDAEHIFSCANSDQTSVLVPTTMKSMVQDSLLDSSDKSNGIEIIPEIIQVPLPPTRQKTTSPSTGNYDNVVLPFEQNKAKPLVSPTSPGPSALSESKEFPVHKTLIQISSGSSAHKQEQQSSSGTGDTKVIYLVETDRVPESVMLPLNTDGNKSKSPMSPPPSPNSARSAINDVFQGAEVTNTMASVQTESVGREGRTHPTLPENPPGFSERLPRVQGPVPLPQTWDNA